MGGHAAGRAGADYDRIISFTEIYFIGLAGWKEHAEPLRFYYHPRTTRTGPAVLSMSGGIDQIEHSVTLKGRGE